MNNPAQIIPTTPDAMRWASAKLKEERAIKQQALKHLQAMMFWRHGMSITLEEAEDLFHKHAKQAEDDMYKARRAQFKVVGNPGTMPGFMVNGHWADMLAAGAKTVETRTYPLPKTRAGVPHVLIKTGDGPAMAIGMITFSHSIKYPTKAAWAADRKRHRVPANDSDFGWKSGKEKHGWVVAKAEPFLVPFPAPRLDGNQTWRTVRLP